MSIQLSKGEVYTFTANSYNTIICTLDETVLWQTDKSESEWMELTEKEGISVSKGSVIYLYSKYMDVELPVVSGANMASLDVLYTVTGLDIGSIWNIKQVVCGDSHTAIIRNDGSLWVCGDNSFNCLGLGPTYSTIDRVSEFTNTGFIVKQVACGKTFTVIIREDDTLWVCGRNDYGQLGLGHNNDVTEFTDTGMTEVVGVTSRRSVTFILRVNNQLWVTGYNSRGGLGLNHDDLVYTFTDTGIDDVLMVGVGDGHSVLIKEDNTIWTTGFNNNGQLGLNDENDRHVFTDTGFTGKKVACGAAYTVIVSENNNVLSTGCNRRGQLGLGDTIDRDVFNDTGVIAKEVFCGACSTVVVKEDDGAWVTGWNEYGQLGLDDNIDREVFVQLGKTVSTLDIDRHLLLVGLNNIVEATGQNFYSQLSVGDTVDRNVPTNVTYNN